MQTDTAQILPIILPTPKAGLNAPAIGQGVVGKATPSSNRDGIDAETLVAGEDSGDQAQTVSAFDQALAQMMMVQVQAPAAIPTPQAPSQQGLTTNPVDITAALDALQPGVTPISAPSMDAEPLLAPQAPPAASPAETTPALTQPVEAQQGNNAPILAAQGPALPVSRGTKAVAAPSASIDAANFAELSAENLPDNPPLETLPPVTATPPSDSAAVAPVSAEQVPLKGQWLRVEAAPLQPTIIVAQAPLASGSPVQASLPQAAPPQTSGVDSAPVVPSDAAPIQAQIDRPSPTSILQAMGPAVSDPGTRVTGVSLSQPLTAPIPADLTKAGAPPAQPVQQAEAQSQSIAPAQAALQTVSAAAAQPSILAQSSAVRDRFQVSGQPTLTPTTPTPASSDATPTFGAPSALAAVAVATRGGASSADTGGTFEEAASDLSEAITAKTPPSEGEASTDIFGASLPLEGRVTQASLHQSASAPLSTSATAPHLAAEISRKFEGKSAQFDVSLTPEGLGKVDVKITINARGEVSAAMRFDNPQAAAELKGRAAELQRALEQSGFSLSREGISFNDGQGQGFGAQQQQASQQDWQETARRAAQNRLFQDTSDLADATALRVAEASSAYSRRSNTGVDVRI